MSATGTLLVELLTEELPPKALQNLSRAFSAGLREGLKSRGYLEASSADAPFATLMAVPANEMWQVVDLRERADGSLLVAASQIVLGPNPFATPAVFVVDRSGAPVQSVPVAGL